MIRLLLLVVLWAGALPASAQTPPPGWIADARTGCRVWNSNPQPKETIAWSGACSNGLAQGRGVLQWFGDGKPTDRYEGDYRDGKTNGRGIYTDANGNRYDGEWRDGEMNGRGASTFVGGNRYDGEYRNGKRNGRGVYTFASGGRYEGEYRDGKPNGSGTYTREGQVYSGTWTNGCFRQGDRWAAANVTAEECGFK